MTVDAADYAGLNETELMKCEREIARRHMGRFPWFMVVWAFANMAVWLSLWPLVLYGFLPLWAGFLIATVNMTLVYLPTHDAQHDIIARPGERLRWFNEFLGHATSWMIASSFEVLRQTHLEHHRYTNDPALDPDYATSARGAWHAIWRSIRERQPDGERGKAYEECLTRIGRSDLLLHAAAYNLVYLAVLCVAAWSGYGLEAFFLWWLPLQLAFIYIDFFLSWAPHHPAEATGRYRDTRAFRSRLGNVLSLGMQYHIVHHLHPRIPLDRNPAAYRELRPILEARGCRLDGI